MWTDGRWSIPRDRLGRPAPLVVSPAIELFFWSPQISWTSATGLYGWHQREFRAGADWEIRKIGRLRAWQ